VSFWQATLIMMNKHLINCMQQVASRQTTIVTIRQSTNTTRHLHFSLLPSCTIFDACKGTVILCRYLAINS
jgi:hypothetical protein